MDLSRLTVVKAIGRMGRGHGSEGRGEGWGGHPRGGGVIEQQGERWTHVVASGVKVEGHGHEWQATGGDRSTRFSTHASCYAL